MLLFQSCSKEIRAGYYRTALSEAHIRHKVYAQRIINEIKDIDIGDGVTFEIKGISNIMDEVEYPGIRFAMNAVMGKLITPMKIDISTGDAITPRAIEFSYKLLLEDRSISLWSYNLETMLAEKLQTVLARGILNTRMRDFYDIRTLLGIYEQKIDSQLHTLWKTYQKKYPYAAEISYEEVIDSTKTLANKIE